ncbi:MAG: nuclear transport factor 2 family protein [Marinobacterium sp.]|nr:nuclear transport factor 2 family protein [Marinobacterium sp.]
MYSPHENTVNAWVALFNQLPTSLDSNLLEQLTHPDVRFVDPFHTLEGQNALRQLLKQFASQVEPIHFEVEDIAWSGPRRCYLRWQFYGQATRLGDWQFPGISELHLDAEGRIILHRDHWDSGQFFYMQLPLIGGVLRWLQRRVQNSSHISPPP